MKIFLGIVIFLLASGNVFADGCNINITPNINYQELNAAFSCLVNRIDKLEKDVRDLKKLNGEMSRGETSSGGSVSSDLLDNAFFSVNKCRVSRSSDGIVLSFVVINKSSNDLLMAILSDSAIVIDADGNSFECTRLRGMNDIANPRDNSRQKYSVLNPVVPTPVSFVFRANRFNGNGVNFKVSLLRLVDDKVVQYSVGKTGLIVE